MTVTLDLKPEVEAGLVAQARAGRKTVEEYLSSLVQGWVEGAALPAPVNGLTPEQRAAAFEAWAAGHRETPPLSDYAVSREAMYEDRDAG